MCRSPTGQVLLVTNTMEAFLSLLTHAIILLSKSEGPTTRPPTCQEVLDMTTGSGIAEAEAKIPYTVLLEGNVGAGKSTFVDILAGEDARIFPVPEPVQMWQNFSGTGVNMLDLMFKDGRRWSGDFQLVSTLSRYLTT